MLTQIALVVLAIGLGLGLYAYIGYPLLLWVLSRIRPDRAASPGEPAEWPLVSISLPAYNEERSIAATLDRILEIDYPKDRLQIVVISDASTDRTDEIVKSYADRGVELLRLPQRGGKTAAENAARHVLRGQVIVNTDASVRLDRNALKPLIAWFQDPTVGVASGRDVSVTRVDEDRNLGESGYVGYEMWLRSLETRVDSIVGASGCFYAIRANLHMSLVPEALSRDFAAALIAREHGMRAVSVNEAVCYVPRINSLQREYRRKVRTMTRGLETLWFKRHLLNPARQGLFAWMLASHKLVRWLAPWGILASLVALAVLAPLHWWAAAGLGVAVVMIGAAWAGWRWPADRHMPRAVAVPAYFGSGTVAALVAWRGALRGELNPIWEPTRRDG